MNFVFWFNRISCPLIVEGFPPNNATSGIYSSQGALEVNILIPGISKNPRLGPCLKVTSLALFADGLLW